MNNKKTLILSACVLSCMFQAPCMQEGALQPTKPPTKNKQATPVAPAPPLSRAEQVETTKVTARARTYDIVIHTREHLLPLFANPNMINLTYLKTPLLAVLKELATIFTAQVKPLLDAPTLDDGQLQLLDRYVQDSQSADLTLNQAKEALLTGRIVKQQESGQATKQPAQVTQPEMPPLFTVQELGLPAEKEEIYRYLFEKRPIYANIVYRKLPAKYAALNQAYAKKLQKWLQETTQEDIDGIPTEETRQDRRGKKLRYSLLCNARDDTIAWEPPGAAEIHFFPKTELATGPGCGVNLNQAVVDVVRDNQHASAANIVKCYKIHLMPREQDIDDTLLRIFDAVKGDELRTKIHDMKLVCGSEKELREHKSSMPKIVIYVENSKTDAQYVLDTMYKLFLDKKDQGAGWTPRWNYRVNSFVFFAQGDGDNKVGGCSFRELFQQPEMIYYKEGLGLEPGQNHYLVDPATGQLALPESVKQKQT